MEMVKKLCKDVQLPRMIKVRQHFRKDHIKRENIPEVVFKELYQKNISGQIKPGMQIAITCGSRGIANVNIITKSIVDFVKQCGGVPFVIPTMGSHGGATAEGQRQILTDYGVTEAYLGCPVKASMETAKIGTTEEGHDVLIDRLANEADGIIVCGRIKAHTAFHGPYESGLMKMITIGLGKQQGAEVCHEAGFKNMTRLLPLFGNVILKNANIICGLGIIENAFDQTFKLAGLPREKIPLEEGRLLAEAKSLMGRILFEKADVLIVDRIGKNISGDGMDPNVTGVFGTPYAEGGLDCQRVVVLDLTKETHGNFNGLGMADVITKRAFDKLDFGVTYPNAITSTLLNMVKVPIYTESDKLSIQLALKSCIEIDKSHARIIRIKDTMHLENIEASEALYEEALANPEIEIESTAADFDFDGQGNLF